MSLKLQKQFDDYDCGFSAAAMIASTSYRRALRLDPRTQKRGLTPDQLAELITKLRRRACRVYVPKTPYRTLAGTDVIGITSKKSISALLLQRTRMSRVGHWVVWIYGHIYDPSFDSPVPVREYADRKHLVVRIVA